MRIFEISYKKKSKFLKAIESTIVVKVSKPKGEIGADAQAALNTFISAVGSLKEYDIIKIQEVDENGNEIGLPITPVEDDNPIVPVKTVVK